MEYFYTTLLGLFTLPVSATLIYILYKIYKAKSNYHTMDNLLIGSSLLLVAMLAVGLCGFATADFEQNKETTAITIKDKWTEGKNYYFVGTNNVVYSISKSIWKSEGYDNIPYIRLSLFR